MAIFFKLLLVAALGSGLGLGATFWMLDHGFAFGKVTAGAWSASPKSGTLDIDPYARAALSRSGIVPLGSAEGIVLLAQADSAGRALDPRCTYVMRGPVPAARAWTLTLLTPDGRLIENAAQRYDFTSREILRAADGTFEIALARDATAGNWLPLGTATAFVLMLRLYDTDVGATLNHLDASALPQIVRNGCR